MLKPGQRYRFMNRVGDAAENVNLESKNVVIRIVKLYKAYISPLLPRGCRFYPTCSDYCIQAVDKLGPIKGIIVSLCRVFRCNQFCKGGFDPLK